MSSTPPGSPAATAARRGELAAFLRLRRERITPADVGLPGGPRRRTPGLRREEVAQRAGVGVAWYTWLEQGRAINPSVQVLDAIARALLLGPAEREHLHRLAGVPDAAARTPAGQPLPPEAQTILDALNPLPTGLVSASYDVLAFNDAYAALDPRMVLLPPADRNVLWRLFTADEECRPLVDWEREVSFMVGQLRAEFGRRLHDPHWRAYIRKLSEASPLFVEMWARHDVTALATHRKRFRTADGREVAITATGFTTTAVPDAKMWVYTPADGEAAQVIGELLGRYREVGAAGLVADGAGRQGS
ncbi:helix-turn-helix transcriptional regulator [Streptomyces tubercidicus]|uniref:Transcriptional regulator n=1 Tax=Streptomyces tubercidicus TaxID=47759 RepID=A0A640UXA1_9ACTN|nr:helix-turn-helix transcriptional regulator [Streptomyces tubercidicus]WAU14249.1 helix-turn-helix transcriptional regulator [Streptomyces tubercidicus]GFE39962.1 transcriptional regulator [Streptomyces tubercidicus]